MGWEGPKVGWESCARRERSSPVGLYYLYSSSSNHKDTTFMWVCALVLQAWSMQFHFMKWREFKKKIPASFSHIKKALPAKMANSTENTLTDRDPEELFRLKWNDFTVRLLEFKVCFHSAFTPIFVSFNLYVTFK